MPTAKKAKLTFRPLLFLIVFGLLLAAGIVIKFFFFDWQTYNSPRGYIIQFPKSWRLDPTRTNEPYERITSPKEKVILAISVYEDKNAATEEGFQSLINEIRQSYQDNETVTLLSFDPQYHPGEYFRGDYLAASLWRKNSSTNEQTEMGLVTGGGHIYVVTANVDTKIAKKYQRVIEKIFLSFQPILK